MNRPQTHVERQTKVIRSVSGFLTAVSLHSHTYHSKENLDFLPCYIEFHHIPILSRLIQSERRRYNNESGKTVDFRRAYWTPPVSPRMVFDSEASQIENKLGLRPLVSITDHDTIAGSVALQGQVGAELAAVSVEWTIPFAGNSFHMGVHNLPPTQSAELMEALSRCTAEPAEETICDLLALLDSFPETLLVLNHPGCNFVRVGPAEHCATLRQFLARCRPWIHALELNGMRPWGENRQVLQMADEYDLPLVAGGDRHGCHANTMLNLSQAQSWGDFVARIREDQRSNILVLPAYEEPVRMRELATAADVLRRYPYHPYGQRRFTDRIYADVEGYSWHPLSFYWDGGYGTPRWLGPAVAVLLTLGSDRFRPILRRLLSLPGEYDHATRPVRGTYSSETLSAAAEVRPR